MFVAANMHFVAIQLCSFNSKIVTATASDIDLLSAQLFPPDNYLQT